jgi:hypothetical protein
MAVEPNTYYSSKRFDWDKFYCLLENHIIIENEPFTVVEKTTFREIIAMFNRPVAEKMVKADTMKQKIMARAEEEKRKLVQHLEV